MIPILYKYFQTRFKLKSRYNQLEIYKVKDMLVNIYHIPKKLISSLLREMEIFKLIVVEDNLIYIINCKFKTDRLNDLSPHIQRGIISDWCVKHSA